MADVDPEDTQSATLIDREIRRLVASHLAVEGVPPEDPSEASALLDAKPLSTAAAADDAGALEENTLDMTIRGRPPAGTPRVPAREHPDVGPEEPIRDAEMTLLDLAAQLGMAPEPVPCAPSPAKARASAPDRPGAPVHATAPTSDKRTLRPEAPDPVYARPPAPEADEHAVRVVVTEGLAGFVPVLLAAFVLLTALGVGAWALRPKRGGDASKHVLLRVLPSIAEVAATDARREGSGAPLLTVETDPEGVLVVLDGKLLGPTPVSFESPIGSGRVAIELTSPYFATWIGEASREPSGGYRVHATLARKR